MSLLGKCRREGAAHLVAAAAAMPGSVGYRIRRRLFAQMLGKLGEGAVFGTGLLVLGPRNITIGSDFSSWRGCTLAACEDGAIRIGDRVSANSNVYVNACRGGLVDIGNDVMIGPNVVMRTSDHAIADPGALLREQGHTPGVIIIENDVWIAANVTVLGGTRIGRGAVVAAGAVVTRDVEPFAVVGGVPARVLKMRAGHELTMTDGQSH
jgi:galactoside O-acetyltransferase